MRTIAEAKNAFVPLAVLITTALVVFVGGAFVVAWRTTYLDSILPLPIKEFFGRGGVAGSSEGSTETSSGTPSEPSVDDPTKDWKTYTNAEFKFSFKYPAGWYTYPLSDGDFLLLGPYADKPIEDVDAARPFLEVSVAGEFGTDYGLDSVLGPGMAPQWEIAKKDIIVGGHSAKRSEHTYKSDALIKIVRIRFDEFPNLCMDFYPLSNELELLDLVLGTFEFL